MIVRLAPFALLLLSCGTRTGLRVDPADCGPKGTAIAVVRSPECDEACSGPCVAFRGHEVACDGLCRGELHLLACHRRAVQVFAVSCYAHAQTGALFRTANAQENLEDRRDLQRAGYRRCTSEEERVVLSTDLPLCSELR